MNSTCKIIKIATALTGMVLICMAAPGAVAAEDAASDYVAPVLSLTIRCTNEAVNVGDEIPVEFEITNRGTNDYKFVDRNYDRSGRMPEYSFIAKNAAGDTVPDPRVGNRGGWFGGGLGQYATLKPGQSFTKVIPLNRWALIKEPGRYVVTGSYSSMVESTNYIQIYSEPINITVGPRSTAELESYIAGLTNQIAGLTPSEDTRYSAEMQSLVMKLMYTCSPKVVPTLLNTIYEPKHGNFWEIEALRFYITHSEESKQAVLAVVAKRGLVPGMTSVLEDYEFGKEQLRPLIARSLAADCPESWSAGALAAQQFGDDSFTARLIAIATNRTSTARTQAIYALALNRTDEGVKVLKQLLTDTSEPLRRDVDQAIRTAYRYRGNSQGRPLKPEDFVEKYQQPER